WSARRRAAKKPWSWQLPSDPTSWSWTCRCPASAGSRRRRGPPAIQECGT
ncbi:MAG: hypothetical protein AVDCRST_MAG61-2268, partial [uncultured Friedmanniella sp.]